MSDFIKSQMDARNNLIAQAREVLDFAQAEARGLSAEENQKIARIEADIDQADTAIETARKLAEREARASEAAASFTPSAPEASNTDAEILRSIAMGETRGHEFAREARAALVPSSNTVGQSFYNQVFEIAQLVGPMLTTSEVFNNLWRKFGHPDSHSDLNRRFSSSRWNHQRGKPRFFQHHAWC
jgi:hypothetical protein